MTMARPRLMTDEALLVLAREEFLEHGSRASTARIADRAGLSEAAIFKRFGSKANLLELAIRECLRTDVSLDFPEAITEPGLLEVATKLHEHFERIVPMMLMVMMHMKGERPEELRGPNPRPMRGARMFTKYFRAQVQAGHLRTINPTVLAHAFTGALWHFTFVCEALDEEARPTIAPATFLRDYVSLLWPGIRPELKPRRTARGQALKSRSAKPMTAKDLR
jgi:AcrR family transcriptional regulator